MLNNLSLWLLASSFHSSLHVIMSEEENIVITGAEEKNQPDPSLSLLTSAVCSLPIISLKRERGGVIRSYWVFMQQEEPIEELPIPPPPTLPTPAESQNSHLQVAGVGEEKKAKRASWLFTTDGIIPEGANPEDWKWVSQLKTRIGESNKAIVCNYYLLLKNY